MEIEEKINLLYDKDSTTAYKVLLDLEEISRADNKLYCYMNDFINMLDNESSYIRVRGFRLICENSRWDNENIINNSINIILTELEDEKPTAVRQCLKSLKVLIENKKELNIIIKEKLLSINYLKYKDSMQGLIFKDVDLLLKIINF